MKVPLDDIESHNDDDRLVQDIKWQDSIICISEKSVFEIRYRPATLVKMIIRHHGRKEISVSIPA